MFGVRYSKSKKTPSFTGSSSRRGNCLPTDDEEYEMYQLVRQRMAESGYVQYEVSNFSLDGFESRHNQTYWRNEPYSPPSVSAPTDLPTAFALPMCVG